MDKRRSFARPSGLPDDATQSLHQDDRGRVWVFTGRGLAYFDGRGSSLRRRRAQQEVFSMAGDGAGDLWLSTTRACCTCEKDVWSRFPLADDGAPERSQGRGRREPGGVWLAFWTDGGVLYFEDGKVRASYTRPMGWARARRRACDSISDGALWAQRRRAASAGSKMAASRRSRAGTVCPVTRFTGRWKTTIVRCGCTRPAACAYHADRTGRVDRRPEAQDRDDGLGCSGWCGLRAVAPSPYGPPVAKAADGKLWFVTGEGVQVVDPRHLAVNTLAPPVLIEQVVADGRL